MNLPREKDNFSELKPQCPWPFSEVAILYTTFAGKWDTAWRGFTGGIPGVVYSRFIDQFDKNIGELNQKWVTRLNMARLFKRVGEPW